MKLEATKIGCTYGWTTIFVVSNNDSENSGDQHSVDLWLRFYKSRVHPVILYVELTTIS